MSLHRDLMDVIPNCAPCQDDDHNNCIPIVENRPGRHTVCACFTAHPTLDAHQNAIFWRTTDGNKPKRS